MTPADLARRLFRDQCGIGPNSSLEAYGETAAVKAMVPLIEALQAFASLADEWDRWQRKGSTSTPKMIRMSYGRVQFGLEQYQAARAALTPQPEEVA